MKLLFDANLSPKLVARFTELFPGSMHVFDTDLERFTSDEIIWDYAKARDLTIVTADADFIKLSQQRGSPPKVVRLANCNYKTVAVETVLRRNAVRIAQLEISEQSILILKPA